MEQIVFNSCITCSTCKYGRDLLGNDYGCRNEKRIANGEKLVNKGDYSCEYEKELKE